MKKYEKPDLFIVSEGLEDVIMTSGKKPFNKGEWDEV